jgi:hypothetical protein
LSCDEESCSRGYGNLGSVCEKCPSNCARCHQTEDNSLSCVEGACNYGYGNSGSACARCPANCNQCTFDSSTCDQDRCHLGYTNGESGCVACPENCGECKSKDKCEWCFSTYKVSEKGDCIEKKEPRKKKL